MQNARNQDEGAINFKQGDPGQAVWVVHGPVHSNLQAFFRSTPNATPDRAERSGCGVFFLAIEEEDLKRAFTRNQPCSQPLRATFATVAKIRSLNGRNAAENERAANISVQISSQNTG